ncbi:hypothetical protein F4802DRAFT_595778 [Xylaria palmicola]|nr:hypothetical protein F4802DRAFT_595778 [Xylaria palmicola]
MASGGLPLVLRLVPLISSTASLWYAWDQYEQITLFRKPESRVPANQILPHYFVSFFNRGLPRVIGLLAITASSCGAVLRYGPAAHLSDTGAYPWYIAGMLFAIAHVAWGPFVLVPVRAIGNDAREKNIVHLEDWLRLHVWRSLTVDIGAWICCLVATVKLLS